MDRRKFIASSTGAAAVITLGAGCNARQENPSAAAPPPARGFYEPVVSTSAAGLKVIHDRQTFIEQVKYETFEPGRDWKDDSEVWMRYIWRWAGLEEPIQRRPAQVLPGLYLLGPDDYHQSIYLLDTGGGLLLVDPSFERFQPLVETQIRQLGYSPDDVRWILLTHMHWDHSQSAHAWEDRGAEVYISSEDEGYVTGAKSLGSPHRPLPPVRQPATFADGETVSFGPLELRAIATPGHTPGSFCFGGQWQGTPLLITGDIVLHFGRHAWMGAGYCDWGQYLASLWKLHEHPDRASWQVMLPGHGTVDLENAGDSIYRTIQVVSEIMRRRRAGSDIEWSDPHVLFWQVKNGELDEMEVLRS